MSYIILYHRCVIFSGIQAIEYCGEYAMDYGMHKSTEHVTIISGCGNIHQREHWLVGNQPVLPLMDITTTISFRKHSFHGGAMEGHC